MIKKLRKQKQALSTGNMKIVYKAGDITEAHIVSGLLNASNIETHVGGYYLQGGIGDLAAMNFVNVQVDDKDVPLAKDIIAEYESNNTKQAKIPRIIKPALLSKALVPVFLLIIIILIIYIIIELFA